MGAGCCASSQHLLRAPPQHDYSFVHGASVAPESCILKVKDDKRNQPTFPSPNWKRVEKRPISFTSLPLESCAPVVFSFLDAPALAYIGELVILLDLFHEGMS